MIFFGGPLEEIVFGPRSTRIAQSVTRTASVCVYHPHAPPTPPIPVPNYRLPTPPPKS